MPDGAPRSSRRGNIVSNGKMIERDGESRMKKLIALFTAVTLLLGLCACAAVHPGEQVAESPQGPTWQEQYDLGVRYLSEGNYEGAIIAFTAAIEIDPKQAPAYVGRGDAYVLSGETEENLAAAKTDYEKAIELDETSVEAYLGLAGVYARQGNYEKALEILRQGLDNNGDNQAILDKILEFENKFDIDDTEPWGNENYDDLSPAQQQLVCELVDAMEQQNWEQAWALLEGFEPDYAYSFTYHEYRIKLGNLKSIEIHPKEGVGLYCYYNESETFGYNNSYWCYMIGNCQDWNWNGEFYKQGKTIGTIGYDKNKNIVIFGETLDICTGVMKNGLLDGTVLNKSTTNPNKADASEFVYEQHFKDGICEELVEQNGTDPYVSSAICAHLPNDKNWDWSR